MNTQTSHIGNLDKVMAHNIIRYSGCLIYRNRGGYVFSNKFYNTIEEAKAAVDKGLLFLRASMVRSGAIKETK